MGCYLLKFGELLVALMHFPFRLSDADLDDVLSKWLLLVFTLFDDSLAHCNMQVLLAEIRQGFLANGVAATAAALFHVHSEQLSLY